MIKFRFNVGWVEIERVSSIVRNLVKLPFCPFFVGGRRDACSRAPFVGGGDPCILRLVVMFAFAPGGGDACACSISRWEVGGGVYSPQRFWRWRLLPLLRLMEVEVALASLLMVMICLGQVK